MLVAGHNLQEARVIGFSGPGMHGWQDTRTVKSTLDARSITKKTSQTEITAQVFDEATIKEFQRLRSVFFASHTSLLSS